MSHLIGLGILGIIGSLVIAFLPTILAFIKGNANKTQTLIYQVIVNIINIVICFLLNHLPNLFIFRIIRNVWDVLFIIMWIYFLICAIKDKSMPRP